MTSAMLNQYYSPFRYIFSFGILNLVFYTSVSSSYSHSRAGRIKALHHMYDNPQAVIRNENIWKGRWFPHERVEKFTDTNETNVADSFMFNVDPQCDDGKTNLKADWDESPLNYTCFDKNYYLPNNTIKSLIEREIIPPAYRALHACMNESISYSRVIPSFGTHRPVWAIYGKYKFIPVQRWLHNLEHGALVMLYHPCAHPSLIQRLERLVMNCTFKHVITPYNLLSEQRPLALVTWGWTLTMNSVQPSGIRDFMRKHAGNAPETTDKNGLYSHLLIAPSSKSTPHKC